jgi:hypothetical protein
MPASVILSNPRRYFDEVGAERSSVVEKLPICLYLEVTNRCNLLCQTCPRTFEALEPPADMSWELFTSIVDQVPNIARVVLHGVGEPMLVKNLPGMIRYLKNCGTYVLFNTNGTLMQPATAGGPSGHGPAHGNRPSTKPRGGEPTLWGFEDSDARVQVAAAAAKCRWVVAPGGPAGVRGRN